MALESLPVGWNSGVLSQVAGNFVLPLTSQSQKERLRGGWALSGVWAGALVGFVGGSQRWEAGDLVLALP